MIAPTDQMSTPHAYSWQPRSTSGARYHSVTTSCVYARSGTEKARASPKSASLITPFRGVTRMFCGLRSRWRMRCEWQNSRPFMICQMNDLTVVGCSLFDTERMYFFTSKSHSSKAT